MESITYLLRLNSLIENSRTDLRTGRKALALDTLLVSYIYELCEKGVETFSVSDKDKTIVRTLLEFLGSVPKVHLSQRTVDTFIGPLNLSCFHQLNSLSLTKISLDRLQGVNLFRSRLESFICRRCVNALAVFKDEEFWSDLRVLILTSCRLESIDFNPFRVAPFLRHLNLSCNKLCFVPELEVLDHLEHLDLSFNCLKKLPRLSSKSIKKIQVFLISNNQIASLAGLRNFLSLSGMDVSFNCLLGKHDVRDVFYLKSLVWANLSNNPVTYLPDYRLYILQNMGSQVPPFKFVLDNFSLSPVERTIYGMYNKTLMEDDTFSYLGQRDPRRTPQQSIRGKRRAREVIIEENDEEGSFVGVQIYEEKENEDYLETKKQVESLRQKFGKDNWLHSQSGEVVQDLMGLKKPEQLITYEVPHYDLVTKASLAQKTIDRNFVTSSPKKPKEGESSKTMGTIVTVAEVLPQSQQFEEEEENGTSTINDSLEAPGDVTSELIGEFSMEPVEEQTVSSNEEAEETESPLEGTILDEDETLWIVQKMDTTLHKGETIFLVLSETELKEKSTSSGLTITNWSLDSVISCVKVKNDPLTLEIEFDTLKKDKQYRTYVMEFADAQVLIEKITAILESRPLSALNQTTYKCMKCSSLFSNFITITKGKNGVTCQVCGSTLVVEMEEPRLPCLVAPEKGMSYSPSESSIGSAASLDQSVRSIKISEIHTPRRCESDVEIISNPSQSSIEVLEDPNRKRSNEEKQGVAAVPQLGTVPEISSTFPALTESSSSGSLTESVVTAYESHATVGKRVKSTNSVLEEGEESPEKSPITHEPTDPEPSEASEEESIIPEVEDSVYSYTDFADIDHRIKLYLYSSVFESDEEHPSCLARCHLWKTGGSDFDGCVVFTDKSLYILGETSSEYGEDASTWLTKMDSYKMKDIKLFYSLVWGQGVGIQIKNLHVLALFQDRIRTDNFLSFVTGLNVKFKIQKAPNSKTDLLLHQLAVESNVDQKSLDPTVNFFTIASRIAIYRDDVCHDTMRLVGLIVTSSELHIVVGDMGWLTGSSSARPEVHSSQVVSSLIESERTGTTLFLHFLDEANGVEETWSLTQATEEELEAVIKAIQGPWELLFSVPLQVTMKS